MSELPIPINEKERLEKLAYYNILDSDSETTFDDLTKLAANILDVPIVLVSLVDKDRQWFKSKYGLDADQTSRDVSFCQYAIMNEEVFEINDASKDDRFKDNPLVTGDPNIRFYAGTPLVDEEGYAIGTLCAIDRTPKSLSEEESESLKAIGRTVIKLIQLRREKQEVESLSKVKDEFLANMSHEIRTPLNAIIGFNELLKKSNLSMEQEKNVEIVSIASKNLLALLNNILDLSKIESNKLNLSKQVFSLEKLSKDIASLHKIKAQEKGVKLRISYDYDIPEFLMGDPARLTQIFGNLISNAVKFTHEGSVNFIIDCNKLSDSIAHISFQIEDTGIGIHQDELKFLFQRFRQVDQTTTKQHNGSGLGLFIAKELVELHGGQIKVESKENHGTTFTVNLSFDLCTDEELSSKPTDNPLEKMDNPLSGIKILLVEDNEHNQILADNYLSRNGAIVKISNNGLEAIEDIKKDTYDFVLMDLQMPIMDGTKATQVIREELKMTIPIVACSAYSTGKEHDECVKLGMNDYIAKPYSEETLISTVLTYANKSATEIQHKQNGNIDLEEILSKENVPLIFKGIEESEGQEYLKKMLDLFQKRVPKDIEVMKNAIASKNLDDLMEKAHLLRGSLVSINLIEGGLLAEKVEKSARSTDIKNCVSNSEALIDYLNSLLKTIKNT